MGQAFDGVDADVSFVEYSWEVSEKMQGRSATCRYSRQVADLPYNLAVNSDPKNCEACAESLWRLSGFALDVDGFSNALEQFIAYFVIATFNAAYITLQNAQTTGQLGLIESSFDAHDTDGILDIVTQNKWHELVVDELRFCVHC
jgi:hypothetical protein